MATLAAPVTTPPASAVSPGTEFGLPVVSVTPSDLTSAPLNILPLAVILERKLIPYRLDESTKTLFVAVADPAELKRPAPPELQDQRRLGRTLNLGLIQPEEFTALVPALTARFSTSGAPVSGATPRSGGSVRSTVDLTNRTIPRAILLKIPLDVARQYRVFSIEVSADGQRVTLATDRPNDPATAKVVAVITAKRSLSVELITAPTEQLNRLLDAYGTSADPISLAPPPPRPRTVSVQSAPLPRPSVAAVPPLPRLNRPPLVSVPGQPPLPPATPAEPISPKSAVHSPSVPTPTPPPLAPLEAEAMPVDTSPVSRPIPKNQPAKIQLATLVAPVDTPPAQAFPLPALPSSEPLTATDRPIVPQSTILPARPSVVPLAAAATSAPVVPQPPRTSLSPSLLRTVPTVVSTPLPSAPAPLASPSVAAEVTPAEISTPAGATALAPLESTDDQNLDATIGSVIASADELESVVKTGLVPKMLAAVLQYAVGAGASDIHLEATEDSLRVRYRIDGLLQDVLKAPLALHAPLISRIKIIAKMKIDEQRIPQDGRFTATTSGRDVDFRVSSLPAIHGEKMVLRLLDKSMGVKAIEQLGLEGTNGERVTTALKKPFGIILVTGPTGSGKTTTLYAMLNSLNAPGVNIVTLEDPVEYELPGITQTQVKPKIGFSFAEGLRSILRQDPDIIMVGEIRDRETASLATHAALTGHLVLSTLHTNNAAGAIPRFLNMGVEPFLIASSIEAVIAQRLVRRLCEACRQPVQLARPLQQAITAELARSTIPAIKAKATEPLQFQAPKGCPTCHDGYKGRLGIYEVMTVSPEIEALTAKKATLSEIQQVAEQQGMMTMKQDGILKALTGATSLDEILRVTTSD